MGTSRGYQMPSGGPWTPLKNEATRFVREGGASPVAPQHLVQQYLQALGGPGGLSGHGIGGSGTGAGGGSGGGRRAGASAVRVGRNVGRFLSRVGAVGLAEALREVGLAHLVGQSAAEIAAGLLDALAGPASTIDDAVARSALARLADALLAEARTPAEVDQALATVLDGRGVAGILMQFFTLYIFERFCRDFYERWVRVAGSAATRTSLASIQDYIDTALQSHLATREVTAVQWQGSEGDAVVGQVLADTCAVFGVPA